MQIMKNHPEILKTFPIFNELSEGQIQLLSGFIKSHALTEGDYLFKEGDPGESFFLIEKGSVEIFKKKPSSEDQTSLTTLSKGEVVGEMASLGGVIHTTSAKALSTTHLLEISMKKIAEVSKLYRNDLQNRNFDKEEPNDFFTKQATILESQIASDKKNSEENLTQPKTEFSDHFDIHKIYLHLQNKLSQFVTLKGINSNNALIASYKKQLEHEKARSGLSHFIINLNILLFLYTFTIKALADLKIETISTTIISLPVLSVFAFAMLRMIKKSGYPWKMYGFTLQGYKKSLWESFLLTIPVLGIVTLYKWIHIQIDPSLHHIPLFQIGAALNPSAGESVSNSITAFLILGYAVFVPVQEMIYRGAMQNTLEQFLSGKNRTWLAICISNLPFSIIHLHVSLVLTIIVYFFGLFWGWLFARQRTLVGCTFSHFLLGIWAFFIVGLSDVFKC